MLGFYVIYQLVTVLSLRSADHFDQLCDLALLTSRQLTDLPQRLHNLRFRRRYPGEPGGRPGAAEAGEAPATYHPERGTGGGDSEPVRPEHAAGYP